MKINFSRIPLAVLFITAILCLIVLAGVQLNINKHFGQASLSGNTSGSSVQTVATAPQDGPDISYLTQDQINKLANLYSAKINKTIASGSTNQRGEPGGNSLTRANTDLSTALREYNVPGSVQAELNNINSKAVTWTANYNSVFVKSDVQKKKLLGIKLDYNPAGLTPVGAICIDNSQCPLGQQCYNGACAYKAGSGCQKNSDCGSNQYCYPLLGFCMNKCGPTNPCPYSNWYCDSSVGFCKPGVAPVGCVSSNSCSAGQHCADGICVDGATSCVKQSTFGDNIIFPDSFDWRNVGGKNYMTPVKNQGGCGSCWAFATVGALEGKINAYYNDPSINPNLSEQDLVSCSITDGCDGAWPKQVEGILSNYLVDTGITQENCFPYSANNDSCSLKCSDQQTLKTDSSCTTLTLTNDLETNINLIKVALVNDGPLTANMHVYNDFFSYTHGIYQHGNEAFVGDHVVVIVGYGIENGQRYWIAKNSWGTWWGEEGYFRIAMGDDSSIEKIVVFSPGNPISTTNKKKLCTDNDVDGYCYWGTGTKPVSECPHSCDTKTIEDCNDYDASIYTGCKSLPASGEVDFSSDPTGAKVYIQSSTSDSYYFYGITPIKLFLNVGLRNIKISKGGFFEYTTQVNAIKDKISFVSGKLGVDSSSGFISDNFSDSPDTSASIDGDNIVWNNQPVDPKNAVYSQENNFGSIFSYNVKTKLTKPIPCSKQLGFGSSTYSYPMAVGRPKISGNLVVWSEAETEDLGNGYIYETVGGTSIYIYDLSKSKKTKITDTGTDWRTWHADMFPDVSGNIIVWLKYYNLMATDTNFRSHCFGSSRYSCEQFLPDADISGYDLNKKQQFTIKSSENNRTAYGVPSISGNNVVWSQGAGNRISTVVGDTEIHLYDLTNKTNPEKIISPMFFGRWKMFPSISGNKVVWLDMKSDGTDIKINVYDIISGNVQTIRSSDNIATQPSVSGNRVVWSEDRGTGTGLDVYIYELDSGLTTQVTNDTNDQYCPVVSESAVAWTDLRDATTPSLYIRSLYLNVPVFVSPSVPVIGQPITFTATASGGNAPYTGLWSGACGGTGSTCTKTFNSVGNYTVNVKVTDAKGAVATNSISVTVASPINVIATVSPNPALANQQVTFASTVTGGISSYTYKWSGDCVSNTSTCSKAFPPILVAPGFAVEGTYTANLEVRDSVGQVANKSVTVKVGAPLSVSATASPNPANTNQTVTFTATPYGGTPPYRYSWTGLGCIGSSATCASSFKLKGGYNTTIKVTDAKGATSTSSVSVVVK